MNHRTHHTDPETRFLRAFTSNSQHKTLPPASRASVLGSLVATPLSTSTPETNPFSQPRGRGERTPRHTLYKTPLRCVSSHCFEIWNHKNLITDSGRGRADLRTQSLKEPPSPSVRSRAAAARAAGPQKLQASEVMCYVATCAGEETETNSRRIFLAISILLCAMSSAF